MPELPFTDERYVPGLDSPEISKEEQLVTSRAKARASDARVKQLEVELTIRNARIGELQRALDEKQMALAQVHHDMDAARLQSDSDVRRLEAVLRERTALIGRLEKAASSRDELLQQLQRDLADRLTWAFRTVDTLIAAQRKNRADVANPGAQSSPPPRESAHADDIDVPAIATVASGNNELELVRQALDAEQAERQRLQRIVDDGYKQLRRRVIETIERVVPRRATVVIVSKGDAELLELDRRRAWHFPQDDKAVYAGHYPADSATAVDHLERLRAKGAQFLVFPATSTWWLDHYSEFADHLRGRYRLLFQRDDVGAVFDVRRVRALERGWKTDLANLIEEFQARFQRNPAILDCETALDVASCFPQHTVFSPLRGTSELPYLDATIDVVICRAGSPRTKEARRVAHALFLTATGASKAAHRKPGLVRLGAEWLAPNHNKTTRSVSIVIPCHNGAKVTRACLEALDATLPASFAGEVIVVDDASTDGTQTMLARWTKRTSHARVLRNAKNSGFIASCNRAARAARGEMLVFLNNDTQPSAGWLTALLRTFADHPDAGAVGGKLVFPNGTLQEAGSLVFRDGSAANFGRGHGNPDHPLFSHVRPVDYCSAALLATPRHIFLELHGFDSSYVPAYYEDTDYCFRLREKGYSVYYQPSARVVHHEGASCGTDLARGVKRYQAENQKKFHNRWKRVLEHHPERPGAEDLETWQRLSIRTFDRTVTR